MAKEMDQIKKRPLDQKNLIRYFQVQKESDAMANAEVTESPSFDKVITIHHIVQSVRTWRVLNVLSLMSEDGSSTIPSS